MGDAPSSVAIADFNRDGKPDLAVSNELSFDGGFTVSILLGNGDGTFASQVGVSTGTTPTSVSVGDFNRDGNPDLVVASYGDFAVSVLLGYGDGGFGANVEYGEFSSPVSVAVGDFDQDGNLDLAVGVTAGPAVEILLGSPDGVFGANMELVAGSAESGVTSVALGDFNGDGKLDVAATSVGTTSQASVLLNTTPSIREGTFSINFDYSTDDYFTLTAPGVVAVGDFNQDGILDLATASYTGNSDGGGTVDILLGYGDGGFAPRANFPTDPYPTSVVVADFNRDGRLDVATCNDSSTSVLLGNGDGTFADQIDDADYLQPTAIAVGDFNGDGIPDLVVGNSSGPGGISTVNVLLGNGAGGFTVTGPFLTGYVEFSTPDSIAVADFNGDGHLDVALANTDPSFADGGYAISVLLGDGSGSLGNQQPYVTEGAPLSIAVGDFNLDGNLDLVVTTIVDEGPIR